LKVYLASNVDEADEEENGLLPAVSDSEKLEALEIKATERFTRPPARYAEASLVKKLEELGIGRPSTYAPTITTIQNRGYVEKKENEGQLRNYQELTLLAGSINTITKTETTGKEKNRLSPTDIGVLVTRFLSENFENVLDYNFTAKVEAEFDEIAGGRIKWTAMLEDFYKPFHVTVENTLEHSARATGERELGIHPSNGRKVIARMGRFGPMAQIGDEELDGEKPLFASLLKNQSIHTISLEEVLELFKLPRMLGAYEELDVKANIGRFGPYVQHGKAFISIPKEDDPISITLERAIELIVLKKEVDANRLVKSFDEREDVTLLNGRWGVYLKIGKDNFKLPKEVDVEKISLEECLTIAKNQPQKSKAKKIFKKK
jgi:DNA topoisomerase-1